MFDSQESRRGPLIMNIPHVLLTSEQFNKLATKDDIGRLEVRISKLEKNSATKDDLKNFAKKYNFKNFATKDDLKDFAKKDDLKNFPTKDDLKNFPTKDDFNRLDDKLDLRFNQLEYMITTSFDHLDNKIDNMERNWQKHDYDINSLQMITADHALRIKKLEPRTFPAK